jgi:hypothetical protein
MSSKSINDQFGYGIIAWNTPLLFRTPPPDRVRSSPGRPISSRLANQFKTNSHPLGAQPVIK